MRLVNTGARNRYIGMSLGQEAASAYGGAVGRA
jgi:hypothetical protein